ncbi:hypothetical protein EHQ13_01025 [Leptospira gomenensis]|uniref:CHASE2 domain-containing protein n=1 Tax=Leptospira gomenensis TaxID=2484974 RepID=A0A5F1Z2G1_9LEPT|nr:hypothetical protein EHQ17_09845 [Leptospira gomenensis]TGK51004.1 hypothetical protein EHQ07_03870 [Leptospira gomenensis]TGK68355.1 hypothetical protein EHQ13_01025 [Leptospira gomenensis]
MVKYILLGISIVSCNYYIDPKLEEISNQKEKIVLVDIDAESDEYMGERKKFRDSLIKMVDKIKKLRPSVIYLNNSFINSSGGEKEFATELNRNMATISAFELNDSGEEINFTEDIKNQIGKTIKGRFYGRADNYGFTGINFPSIEIVKKSKAICSSKYYINDSNEVEFVYSLNRYKNYEFENCPFTVVNEYLISYGLKIALDKIEGKVALYSINNGKIKKIKNLNQIFEKKYNAIPIKFKTFRKFTGKEILEKEEIKIDLGYIYIINTLDIPVKVKYNRMISNSEVFGSMVYTLLDSITR